MLDIFKQLIKYKLPEGIEGAFVEVRLRKTKWLIFGAQRPPCQSLEYFFKHAGFTLDIYRRAHEKFLLARDFYMEDTDRGGFRVSQVSRDD